MGRLPAKPQTYRLESDKLAQLTPGPDALCGRVLNVFGSGFIEATLIPGAA